MQIPWGDVSTAYRSTGIPDIEVFSAMPLATIRGIRVLARLARVRPVASLLQGLAGRFVRGSSAEERAQGQCLVWGEVRDDSGKAETLRMRLPEGYGFTAVSAIAAMEKVLAKAPGPGALTPTLAFGIEFCLGLPDVRLT